MNNYTDADNYEVGYGKPPISARFPKGISGNPSGRRKRAPDFGSELLQELNTKVVINENGKRKVITKRQGMAKQLVNKAVTGNLMATRIVIPHYQQELVKIAEQWQKSLSNPNLDVRDLSTDELMALIQAGAEESVRPKLEKSLRVEIRKSIRTELEQSIRADLEKSIRRELEKSIGADANGRKRGSRPKTTGGTVKNARVSRPKTD
jgi:hypothetical protein